jgi:upstream activation factor subunit UAF30
MAVSHADLESALRDLIAGCDMSVCTIKEIRRQLEERLGMDLSAQKDKIKVLVTSIIQEGQEDEADEAEENGDDDEAGDEDADGEAAPKSSKKREANGDSFTWSISQDLMELLGADSPEMSFKEAQSRVQEYVKRLQKDPADGRKYQCDGPLAKLFGVKKIALFGIGKHLKKHIRKWVESAVKEEVDSSDEDVAKSPKKRAAPKGVPEPAAKKAKGKSGDDESKRAPGGFAKTQYALSEAMQHVTGEAQLSRPQVVKKLWEYIKAKELQNPANKSEIVCDAPLKAVFGVSKVTAFSMNKYIGDHLTKLDGEVAGEATPKKAKKIKAEDGDKRAASGFAKTQYALSEALQHVTGEAQLSRPQVVKKLWEYIKAKELQNPADKREILCDAPLKRVFGVDSVTAFSLNKHIGGHLTKL